MPTWKDLFDKGLLDKEVCECGKKGVYIISNGSGKVTGFKCEDCYKK